MMPAPLGLQVALVMVGSEGGATSVEVVMLTESPVCAGLKKERRPRTNTLYLV